MNLLKYSLRTNAVFSFVSGLALLLAHNRIAELFDTINPTPFWIIGLALILFSLVVFYESVHLRALQVVSIIAQDMIWVLASIVFVVWNPYDISTAGSTAIMVVAIIVLGFAVAQSFGLSHFDASINGRKKLTYFRNLRNPRRDVWKVISDVSNYHRIAPNIDEVKILSGTGKGLVRQCSHGKNKWTETCTVWEEGSGYQFEVDTTAPDYPFPLSFLSGTWSLEEIEDSTRVRMTFEFRYRHQMYAVFVHPFLRRSFDSICNEIFDNWERALTELSVEPGFERSNPVS